MREMIFEAFDILNSYQKTPLLIFFADDYTAKKFVLYTRENVITAKDIDKGLYIHDLSDLYKTHKEKILFIVSQMEHFCRETKINIVHKHLAVGVEYCNKSTPDINNLYGIVQVPTSVKADKSISTTELTFSKTQLIVKIHKVFISDGDRYTSCKSYEYGIGINGSIVEIKNEDIEPAEWTKQFNSYIDFKPHPYNIESYGLLSEFHMRYNGRFVMVINIEYYVRFSDDSPWIKTDRAWLDYITDNTVEQNNITSEWNVYRSLEQMDRKGN
jgi:hypothetical protein